MFIVKIEPHDNGGHSNQRSSSFFDPPAGWAVVPPELEPLENFPFGEVEADEIDGIMTVTKWTPGIVPEPAPEPEAPAPTPTLGERVTGLEASLAQTDEVAIELYEAMAAQEEINTAQDDALIELYEMIGG